jgi:ferritin-like metal-binding protein YciE
MGMMASLKAMGMSLNKLEDLFLFELKDLYSAEEQLIDALPKMANGSSSPDLKRAFELHLDQTKRHRDRLDQVFRHLGQRPAAEKCEAMEGLIEEGEVLLKARGDAAVKDAALISAAQRVEHYEIAGYGTAATFARRLGHHQAADLLHQTLEEEKDADEKLTQIAESSINVQAAKP